MELVERTVLCQLVIIAPSEERAYLAEVINERVISPWLGRTLLRGLLKEFGIVLTVDMLILGIFPDIMKHRVVHIIYI